MKLSYRLPRLHATSCYVSSGPQAKIDKRSEAGNIYDVSFYPYTKSGADPVFAFAVGRETVVCRIATEGFEILRVFEDGYEDARLNLVVWSQDPDTGDPLICVTGESPSTIKVLNVNSGKLVRTLVGHGGEINALAASPLHPSIIVSGSKDHTARIWDLRNPEKHVCRVLLAGEGHRLGLYTLTFHSNGRYLLTGGFDTAVNVWLVPDLLDPIGTADPEAIMEGPLELISHPHFATTEVHANHVDCVAFYNDLIISKALGEPHILLWQISNFSSKKPLPPRASAPTSTGSSSHTRSAWSKDGKNAFQVLMRFDMPDCNHIWSNFGLFHSRADKAHPLLIMGSENLWISMWDLQLLEEGIVGSAKVPTQRESKAGGEKAVTKEECVARALPGPFDVVYPHKIVRIPEAGLSGPPYITRHFSFSVGGEWCVVVGDWGMICLLRWPERTTKP